MPELWDILDCHGNPTGRLHERGRPMQEGDFHLVVHVWILNSKGEFLISKRTPNKPLPNMWECTGGSAVAGDDSLTTALKEVREEMGITLEPQNGQLFKQYKHAHEVDVGAGAFVNIWLFRQDVDLSDVVLQPGETCDAMLAGKDKISRMIEDGTFCPREVFPYLDELFNSV